MLTILGVMYYNLKCKRHVESEINDPSKRQFSLNDGDYVGIRENPRIDLKNYCFHLTPTEAKIGEKYPDLVKRKI